MPALAVTPVDVLLVLGLGAAGFVVVVLVCAGVLAMLQLILPEADSGAAELDSRLGKPAPGPEAEQPPRTQPSPRVDSGGDA